MFLIAACGIVFNLILERVVGGHGHAHGHSHGHAHGHNHQGHRQDHGDYHPHAHSDDNNSIDVHLPTEATPIHHHGHEDKYGHHHHNRDHEHGHEHDHEHGHEHAHVHGQVETETSNSAAQDGVVARNLSLDAAYLHVIGDLVQSVGVALAGLIIWHDPSWKVADPLCTWLFGLIVMYTTLQMLWSNVTVLLEGVPEGLDVQHIKDQIMGITNGNGEKLVTNVHDLHVWSVTPGFPMLTAHVSHSRSISPQSTLAKIHEVCLKMGIRHATIQILPDGSPCTSGICCN